MIIAVPKEIIKGENRVAATPDSVGKMIKKGLEVRVESGAGQSAFFSDSDYENAGAKIVPDAASLYADADIVIKVQRPVFNETCGKEEADLMKEGAVLITMLQPLSHPETAQKLASRKVSAFSMDLIPRITRAQRMDVLSSMSSLAGYKAVLIAAASFGKFIPMMTTAAGTLPPAKVLIIGAGVAGLQAIATAKRLGAQVEAFDTRPAVKEQVQSLGATFVELELGDGETEDHGGYAKELSAEHHQKELALIHEHVKGADVVITTALIPGKKAPLLITAEMVSDMKKGSVIIDLAAELGGNCELTRAEEEVLAHGVTIIGVVNLPASLPIHASQMYAKNMTYFFLHLYVNNELTINLDDEITKGALVTHQGKIVNDAVKALVN
ncbi:MAG: Re/Si-specific NAD(P)(+) transhydrogenase subunit alpha [Nitrospira sp.]|nr:Re/Si-specific NAD(P)(+) transhydrogenase subunit alpha [Candidatus Manganitrophaceae bacterium]HIL34599.1 Re/Si-specific NAD(P)(+) transhydrogenase subunit alpha [Candidatus Manganitrophaceae bacterium]